MKTSLVPIIKSKTVDSSDKNNYRPIALVTTSSKLFEICILEILEMYLVTHDQQFGFKSKQATDMCIFTVKSIIKYFTEQNTPVYACFLDASKVFDRITHWTLFHKLINKIDIMEKSIIMLFFFCVFFKGKKRKNMKNRNYQKVLSTNLI